MHALILTAFFTAYKSEAKSGEFQMLPIFPMGQEQVSKLHKQFSASDDYISKLKKQTLSLAENYLMHTPSPLKVMHYEGKLNTDPKRQATVKALDDMRVISLLTYAVIMDNPQKSKYFPKIKELILSWAKTYRPTGNPINENKLEPIFCSYYTFKSFFSSDEQQIVEGFIKEIVKKEKLRKVSKNNWFTKKVKLLLYAGLILEDKKQISWCIKEFEKYIAHSLRANGSSIEIEHRDAMSYHVAGLKPLLQIAIILNSSIKDPNFYELLSENGCSLKKSSEFVLPYAKKEKVYEQWRNTKVKLDKQRAAAGIAKYQPGYKWKPESGTEFYIMASFFDAKFNSLAEKYTVEDNDKLLKVLVNTFK